MNPKYYDIIVYMTQGNHYDMFQSLHLRNPDGKVYALIEQITELLEQMDPTNERETSDKISELLGDAESARVFELICLKLNVDYTALLQLCEDSGEGGEAGEGSGGEAHVSPKLLLHILLFSVSYVCNKLQVDQDTVNHLIDQLKVSFTIDSPLSWLKSFLALTEQERKYQEKRQDKLMKSGYAVGQATDTAEERRVKQRTGLHDRLRNMFNRWL